MEFQHILAALKRAIDDALVGKMLLRPGRQDGKTEPGSHLTHQRMSLRGPLGHPRLKSRLLKEMSKIIVPTWIERP